MVRTHERGERVEIIKGGPYHGKLGEVVLFDAGSSPPLYVVRLDEPLAMKSLAILKDEDMICAE